MNDGPPHYPWVLSRQLNYPQVAFQSLDGTPILGQPSPFILRWYCVGIDNTQYIL